MFFHLHHQVRDVEVVTMTVRDVAPRKIPARRARVTVTDLGTEVSMMVMPAARVIWCVGVTTVSSLGPTSTRRTTAVRSQHLQLLLPSLQGFKERSSRVSFYRIQSSDLISTTLGWGLWSDWGPCSHTCGAGRKSRRRQCLGKCKNHHLFENQERICINPECNFL